MKDDSAGSEGTFIASAQSQTQRDMIEMHPVDTPLYVEGRFTVWLRDVPQTYFILRADSDPKLFEVPEEDVDGKLLALFRRYFHVSTRKNKKYEINQLRGYLYYKYRL